MLGNVTLMRKSQDIELRHKLHVELRHWTSYQVLAVGSGNVYGGMADVGYRRAISGSWLRLSVEAGCERWPVCSVETEAARKHEKTHVPKCHDD